MVSDELGIGLMMLVKIVLGKAYTMERLREYDDSFDAFKLALALSTHTDTCREEIMEGIQRMAKHSGFQH
jgi:hypothetical protein